MADVGIPRIIVKLNSDEHPELVSELAPLNERSRAGRLRFLAALGLAFQKAQHIGLPPAGGTAHATNPHSSAAVAPSPIEKELGPQTATRKRLPTKAGGAMIGLGAKNGSEHG